MQAQVQAVSNPNRRAIMRLVWDRELTSSEIAEHFEISWPAISQNLKVLREAGLIRERRDGNRRFYRADRKVSKPLEAVLRRMWENDLDRLASLAEDEERRARRRPR